MLKKFKKLQNSSIYGRARGRLLRKVEFFEHYSVLFVLRLGKLHLF